MRGLGKRLWWTWVILGFIYAAATVQLGAQAQEGDVANAPARAPTEVVVARLVNDPIVSATERYITARLDVAEAKGVPFVLVLDTPGGAVDTTRAIVRRFLSAKVPVLVLVGPPGSRAGSAGVFITMAAHVAGMTPGTNIGAAHPIGAGVGAPSQPGEEQDEEGRAAKSEEEVLAEKIENDLIAFAEAIAKARDRNVEWAIEAVRDSASVPADRALELGVVDLIAPDLDAFLAAADGRTVMVEGEEVTLYTKGAKKIESERSLRERIQITINDPSVAYTLMSLGVLGIVMELYNPGMLFGGIFGGICLVLGISSGLPFSSAGILLLAAAGLLFVLEVYLTSFGLLSIAGGVCLVLGGIFLFEAPADIPTGGEWALEVGTTTLATVGGMGVAFGLIMAYLVAKAHLRRPVGGEDGMLGEEGTAVLAFEGGKGRIFIHGEYWHAVSQQTVNAGDTVVVSKVLGLKLEVEPVGGQTTDAGAASETQASA